jgi:hypothetical protein
MSHVTLTLSPPVRIAALVGLVAAVVLGGGMTLLGHRGQSSEAAVTHVINKHPFGLHAKKTHAAKSAPVTKPSKTRPAAPVQTAPERPSLVAAALAAGVPGPVATALGRYPTVVVSLYNPYSQVDGISFAEARAGAQLAGVGFVPLDVLSKAQVGKLTEQLGLLPDPGLLIYVRPGTIAARISGFADKETVAQAAQNAAASP